MELDSSAGIFVGRDRELAQLGTGLSEAIAGRGRLFLLSGEPGIGKTRLAEEIAGEASSRGIRVIWGRCWEGGGAPAYWPFIQILRACAERPDFAQLTESLGSGIAQLSSLVPEIIRPIPVHGERVASGRPDAETARFRLYDAVATLLKGLALREPRVLVIEDLHDADLASLQMLRFLIRALKESPVLLIGTHREAEVERSPELRALFAELASDSLQFSLRGLSLDDAALLVRGRTGIELGPQSLATLHQTTAGNPLFLHGVLQMLIAEGKLSHPENIAAAQLKLPPNVRGAIQRQLAGLSERANSVLAIASALGIEFEAAPLERVAAMSTADLLDCLDETAASGIIVAVAGSHGRYKFTHALIRSAIYDSFGSSERVQLHRRISDALEEIHASNIDAHLAELAHHYVEAIPAGPTDKAIDYSIRAGDAAASVFAFDETIAQWQSALELMNQYGGDLTCKANLLTKLGIMLQVNDTRKGIQELEAALSLFESTGDEKRAAKLHQRIGLFLNSPGAQRDVPRSIVHLHKAEKILRNGPDAAVLAALYYGIGQAAKCEFRTRDALASMKLAMEVAERANAIDEWCACAAQYGVYLIDHGRLREAQEVGAKVWEKIPFLSGPLSAQGAFQSGGGIQGQLRNYMENRKWLQRGLDSPLLAKHQRSVLLTELGYSALFVGDLEYARRCLTETGEPRPPLIKFYEGDWDSPRAFFEGWFSSTERKFWPPEQTAFNSFYLSQVLRMQGDNSAGINALTVALSHFPADEPHLQAEMLLRPELALHCVASGHIAAAREQVLRCDEILSSGEDWLGFSAHGAHAAASVAAAAGSQVEADHRFADAVATFARVSLVWDQADVLRSWGRALVARGEKNQGLEKFDAAIEIYRRHGAGQPWIDHTRAEFASTASPKPENAATSSHQGSFCREGEYWTMIHDGVVVRLKDAKGMNYIAELLRRPHEALFSIDLALLKSPNYRDRARLSKSEMGTFAGETHRDLGDAGEMLDATARSHYKDRLDELREEIENARHANDPGRTERASAEFDAIAKQLRTATGLAGRTRKVASHRERARVTVTKRIKASIESIRLSNPALGRHLAGSIHTGHFCSYNPIEPISWQL